MSRVYLGRVIHTTITVMSVLIGYDGWQNLKFRAAVGVILGPVLAMFIPHVLSASLALQAEPVPRAFLVLHPEFRSFPGSESAPGVRVRPRSGLVPGSH